MYFYILVRVLVATSIVNNAFGDDHDINENCIEYEDEFDCKNSEELIRQSKEDTKVATPSQQPDYKEIGKSLNINVEVPPIDAVSRHFGLPFGGNVFSDFPKCPVKVPMCYRTQCGGILEQHNPTQCLSNPSCCFDRDLYQYRHTVGAKYMKGAPVCYHGATSIQYQQIAAMFRPWNAFFTEKILEYYHKAIDTKSLYAGGSYLCHVNPFYQTARIICGWNGITEQECNLRGCCFTQKKKCEYPDMNAIRYYRAKNVYPELQTENPTEQTCATSTFGDKNLFRRLPCLEMNKKNDKSVHQCKMQCCMDDGKDLFPYPKMPPHPYNPYPQPFYPSSQPFNPYGQMPYSPYIPKPPPNKPKDQNNKKRHGLFGSTPNTGNDANSMLMEMVQNKMSSASPLMQLLVGNMLSKNSHQQPQPQQQHYGYDKHNMYPPPKNVDYPNMPYPPMEGPTYPQMGGYNGYTPPITGLYPPSNKGYPPMGGYPPVGYPPMGSYPPNPYGLPNHISPSAKPPKCPYKYKKVKGLPDLSKFVKECCKIHTCYHKKTYIPKPMPTVPQATFSDWSPWSPCLITCGPSPGTHGRQRACIYSSTKRPAPVHLCHGPDEETAPCPLKKPCPAPPTKKPYIPDNQYIYPPVSHDANVPPTPQPNNPQPSIHSVPHTTTQPQIYPTPYHQHHTHPGMSNPHTHYPQQSYHHAHTGDVKNHYTGPPPASPNFQSQNIPPPPPPPNNQYGFARSLDVGTESEIPATEEYKVDEYWMPWGECNPIEGKKCKGEQIRVRKCFDSNGEMADPEKCGLDKVMESRGCKIQCNKIKSKTPPPTAENSIKIPPPGPPIFNAIQESETTPNRVESPDPVYEKPVQRFGEFGQYTIKGNWMGWGVCDPKPGKTCDGQQIRIRHCYKDDIITKTINCGLENIMQSRDCRPSTCQSP